MVPIVGRMQQPLTFIQASTWRAADNSSAAEVFGTRQVGTSWMSTGLIRVSVLRVVGEFSVACLSLLPCAAFLYVSESGDLMEQGLLLLCSLFSESFLLVKQLSLFG